MRLICLLTLPILAFACSGDCASCHFSIDYKDEKHKIMLDCKSCHTDEKLAKIPMQSSCGQDCFSCHDIQKINAVNNAEHRALNTCITCHTSLNQKLNIKVNPFFDNRMLRKK